MSTKPALISRLLDWLHAVGEQPAVNPARVKDGALPPIEPDVKALPAWAYALLVVAMLAGIMLATQYFGDSGAGFIYEQF